MLTAAAEQASKLQSFYVLAVLLANAIPTLRLVLSVVPR